MAVPLIWFFSLYLKCCFTCIVPASNTSLEEILGHITEGICRPFKVIIVNQYFHSFTRITCARMCLRVCVCVCACTCICVCVCMCWKWSVWWHSVFVNINSRFSSCSWFCQDLSTLLFLNCALKADVRCKCFINTPLHYLTWALKSASFGGTSTCSESPTPEPTGLQSDVMCSVCRWEWSRCWCQNRKLSHCTNWITCSSSTITPSRKCVFVRVCVWMACVCVWMVCVCVNGVCVCVCVWMVCLCVCVCVRERERVRE